jgi:hypothetical protein
VTKPDKKLLKSKDSSPLIDSKERKFKKLKKEIDGLPPKKL